MKALTYKKYIAVNTILLVLLILVCLAALNIGPERATIFSKQLGELEWGIIFTTRLPRIILGLLVGLTLASSGTAFQSLLRNPLADPYILGVSGGAALGSVIGVGLGLPFAIVSVIAFISAFLSMLLIYWIAESKGRLPSHTLLLTGVIFNAFAFALIMLIHSLVTMEQAHEILFLLIGSLELYSYKTIITVGRPSSLIFLASLGYLLADSIFDLILAKILLEPPVPVVFGLFVCWCVGVLLSLIHI